VRCTFFFEVGGLYLCALEALIRVHEAGRDWPEMIAAAQGGLVYDNLQEPMVRALMETRARLGECPEALRHYDRPRTTLARELGVEPLPETETLREAILKGDLGVAGKPRAVAPASAHV